MDKVIKDGIRKYGEKVTFDALSDLDFRMKSVQELADNINRGDPRLAQYDWQEKTLGFDLEFIGALFRQINVDSMIDVISNRISAQYDRMVKNNEIKDFLNKDNHGNPEPYYTLVEFSEAAHQRLKAVRYEEAAQRKLEKQLKIVNEQSSEHAQNVSTSFDSDGVPMVDDIYSNIADEMAPYFQEIESLKSLLEEREAEVERLNNELKTNEEKANGLTAMPMAALFKGIAQLINKEEDKTVAEAKINYSELANVVETVTGYNSERVRQAMTSNEKSKGKNVITATHKKTAANAVRAAMPRLADRIMKL